MKSPTQQSLKKLKAEGYMVQVTEHWNGFARRRVDLYGFIDIHCCRGAETLGVQTTSDSSVSARVKKITTDPQVAPNAKRWLDGGTRKIVVHGWGKKGPRGKRKVWTCREVWITEDDFRQGKESNDATKSKTTQTPV